MFAHSLGDGAELKMLEPWHAEQFLAALDRSREHLRAAIPAAHAVFTVEDSRTYLQRFADWHAADTGRMFGIWLDGNVVGIVQLLDFSTAHGTSELGIWLAPDAQGRGLGTRACRFAIDWAIRERGIQRVQWTNNIANERSAATARRLGMTREGLLRSSSGVAGARWDNEVWSIIAAEWPTAESPPKA